MVLAACAVDDFSKIQPIAPEPKRLMIELIGMMSAKAAVHEGELQGATSGTSGSDKQVLDLMHGKVANDQDIPSANDET
jgi:hypothetical protein